MANQPLHTGRPRIVALVPMRHHSERVPGKNYRPFAGKPLYHHVVSHLLACRLVGAMARRLGQPQVVGEMVAGVFLGPSLLGLAFPGIQQALFPARSDTEVVIRMNFIAPEEPDTYRSAWQTFGPDGEPFGDPFFIEIIVALPGVQP